MSRVSISRSFVGLLTLCAVAAGCNGGHIGPTQIYVSSVSPNTGTMQGGTRVTIFGGGFKPGATVQFSGVTAVTSAISSNTITADAPAHAAGAVTIVVTNPDSQSGSLAGGFVYETDPFSISGTITELTSDGEIPVAEVEVRETGTNTKVLTDATGAYRLSGLRRPSFVLSMFKPGYNLVTMPLTATSDVRIDRRITRVPSFVLSGMVFETTANGRVPLNDVVLYCDGCGSPDGHTFVTTDANGLYRFEWTLKGRNWIQFISKDGYRYAGPIEPAGIPVNVDGDTKFDIELVKK